MAKDDIKIGATIDVSQTNIRKDVEKQLADLQASVASSSFTQMKKDIEAKVLPKIKLDITKSEIDEFSKKIRAAIGSVAIQFHATAKSTDTLRKSLEDSLSKLKVGIDPADVKRLQQELKLDGTFTFNFNQAQAEKLRKTTEEYFEKKPIVINTRLSKGGFDNSGGNGGGGGGTGGGGGGKRRKGGTGGGGPGGPSGPNVPQGGDPDERLAKTKVRVGEETRRVTRDLGEYTKATEQASKITSTFAERVGFTAGRLTAYLIPAASIFQLSNALQTAGQSVVAIDSQINKLTQIFEGNRKKAEETAKSVLALSERYGQSATDVLDLTNTLGQAGDKFNAATPDRLVKAVETLSKTKLAATFGDIKQTGEGAIAALNQFKLAGGDLNDVLDVSNELSKKFAFESENLFEAVKIGGGAFALAGGNIKEFAATVSTLRSLTRLPATVIGTAINTISQKSLQPDVVKFTEEITKGVGGIRDMDGGLLSFSKRMQQVAKATQNYTDEQLEPVIEKLSDLRQGKVLIPLLRDLQNPKDSQFLKQLKTADESAGSLSRDAAIGLERIEVKLASIGARFQQVFGQLAENPSIKRLVDQFASLAKTVADALEAVQGILPSLLRLGAIKLGASILGGIPGFYKGLKQAGAGLSGNLPPGSLAANTIPLGGGGGGNNEFSVVPGVGSIKKSTLRKTALNVLTPNFIKNKLAGATGLEDQTGPQGGINPNSAKGKLERLLATQVDQYTDSVLNRGGIRQRIHNENVNNTTKATSQIRRLDAKVAKISQLEDKARNSNLDSTLIGLSKQKLISQSADLAVQTGVQNEANRLTLKNLPSAEVIRNKIAGTQRAYANASDQPTTPINSFNAEFDRITRVAQYQKDSAIGDRFIARNKILAERQALEDRTNKYQKQALLRNPKFAERYFGKQYIPSLARQLFNDATSAFTDPTQSTESPISIQNLLKVATKAQRKQFFSGSAPTTVSNLASTFSDEQLKKASVLEAKRLARIQATGLRSLSSEQLRAAASPEQRKEAADFAVRKERERLTKSTKELETKLRSEGKTEDEIRAAKLEHVKGIRGLTGALGKAVVEQEKANRTLKVLQTANIAYNQGLNISTQNQFDADGNLLGGRGSARAPLNIRGALRRGAGAVLNSSLVKGTGKFLGQYADVIVGTAAGSLFDSLLNKEQGNIRDLLDSNGNLPSDIEGIIRKNKSSFRNSAALSGAATGSQFGAFGGASIGATIGSAGGPLGTAVGSIIGALVGAIGGGAVGGGIGYISSAKGAEKFSADQLFNAASRAKGGDSSSLAYYAVQGALSKGKGIEEGLRTEGGGAFLDRLQGRAKEKALELYRKGKIGSTTDSGAIAAKVAQELTTEFSNEFKKTGSDSIASAVELVTKSFRELEGESGRLSDVLSTAVRNAAEADKVRNLFIESILNNNGATLTQYGSTFSNSLNTQFVRNRDAQGYVTDNPVGQVSTRRIAFESSRKEVANAFSSQFASALLGKGGDFALPEELAKVLSENIQNEFGKIEGFYDAPIPEQFSEAARKNSAGLLDEKASQIFGDVASIQSVLRKIGERNLSGFAGKIVNESNTPDAGIAAERLASEFSSVILPKDLQTDEAKNELKTLFANILKEIRSNPEILQGDPIQFAASRLKEFGNGEIFFKRFVEEIKNLNVNLREQNFLYERNKELQVRQIAYETQSVGTKLNQLRAATSIGATPEDLVSESNKILGSVGTPNIGNAAKNLIAAQNNYKQFVDPTTGELKERTQESSAAFYKLKQAQDEYNDTITRSNNVLSVLQFKFEELSRIVDRSVSNNRTLGVTPIDQRFEDQANLEIFNSTAGAILNKKAPGVRNINELLNLSDDQLKELQSAFSGLAGQEYFINGVQSAERFGSRQAPGAAPGVLLGGQAELASFLAGSSVMDPNGQNLRALAMQNKDRVNVAQKTVEIQNQQLQYLQLINEAIRTAFKLPQTSPKDNFNFRNDIVPTTNLPKSPAPTNSLPTPPTEAVKTTAQRRRELEEEDRTLQMRNSHETLQSINGALSNVNKNSTDSELLAQLKDLLQSALGDQTLKGGRKADVKVDANLNISGFDSVGKDIAMKAIVTSVMENFRDQLGNSPAELQLRDQLTAAIRQIGYE